MIPIEIRSPKFGSKFIKIDNEDLELIRKFKWSLCKRRGTFYAIATKINNRILMHRLIMNPSKGMTIDHIDGDGLNNTKSNMRICTQQQNCMNKKMTSRNTTGFKGVYFVKSCLVYWAYISISKKRIGLGCYKTAIDAAIAYNKAAIKYYGEFAKLNEIPCAAQ